MHPPLHNNSFKELPLVILAPASNTMHNFVAWLDCRKIPCQERLYASSKSLVYSLLLSCVSNVFSEYLSIDFSQQDRFLNAFLNNLLISKRFFLYVLTQFQIIPFSMAYQLHIYHAFYRSVHYNNLINHYCRFLSFQHALFP